MPDIFISYSKIDRAHALKLANELKKRSFNVWWDDDLYASQDYHDVIMSVLNDCKVAVVIWSPDAIKSKWVRDEARRALSKEKLIPTYLPPFNLDNVPLGFGDIQTVDVNDLDEILKALRPFCKPSEPPTAPPTPANSPAPTKTRPIADYDAISNFTSELEDYERQYPARSEAFVTLRNALKYSHTSKRMREDALAAVAAVLDGSTVLHLNDRATLEKLQNYSISTLPSSSRLAPESI